MPRVGDVIGGKYRLDALVGTGGMSFVYSATHLSLDQLVALKFLRQEDADDTSTSRLVREARVVAGLKSEHVARVHDVGVIDDGSPYIVMELLQGSTLEALVREEGALRIDDASECIIQACHALGEAHALGVVHRDIKPSNLFRTIDSAGQMRLKVIDFGISRATSPSFSVGAFASAAAPTKTGAFLGSPPFMSPEQILEAKDVDARSDVWSLGVVLYYLVGSRLPFVAKSLLELMTKIAYEPAPPLSELRPDLPAEFLAIVDRCLMKERDDRFASAAELANALVPFAHDRAKSVAQNITTDVLTPPPTSRIVRLREESTSATCATQTETAAAAAELDAATTIKDAQPRRAATTRWILMVAGAAAVVITALLGGIAFKRSLSSSSSSSSSIPGADVSAASSPVPEDSALSGSVVVVPSASGTARIPKGRGFSPRTRAPISTKKAEPAASAGAGGRPSLPTTPD